MSDPIPPPLPAPASANKNLPWIIGLAAGLPLLMLTCCCCSCVVMPSGDGTGTTANSQDGESVPRSLENATHGRSKWYREGYKAGMQVVNSVKGSNNSREAKRVLLRKNIEHFQERYDHFNDFGSMENTEWNEGARDAVAIAEQSGSF